MHCLVLEYGRYENEHAEIFDEESSDRAFEEEVMLAGFGSAPTKAEGAGVSLIQQVNPLQHVIHTKQLH